MFVKEEKEFSSIEGLRSTTLDIFKDHRGEIWTIFANRQPELKFVEDKITISTRGVLRGFHGDANTVKLVSCLSGQIQLAVADIREGSSTYGNVETFIISDDEPTIVTVPAGCVNAHLCLSDKCVFYYKWSQHYSGPENQVTIAWNDTVLDVDWAIENPILSERDKKGLSLLKDGSIKL